MNAQRGVACWVGLVACLVAQSPSPATLPDDIRAALFAMPRHEPAATGIPVTACDDATSAPLPRASVFVVDPRRAAAASRVPRSGFDLERQTLAVALLAGARYETGVSLWSGVVALPAAAVEPATVELPLDAAGVAAIRAKLAAAPAGGR